MATTTNRLAGRTITLAVRKGTTKEHIQTTLESIYRLSGCLTCGLLGFDVILHGGDPELAGQIHAPESINVSVR